VVGTADVRLGYRSLFRASPPVGSRSTPDHLAGIQPPADSVLDGTVPASGRKAPTVVLSRVWGWSAAAFSAASGPADSSPLTPLLGGRAARVNACSRSRGSRPLGARQCLRASGPEVPSIAEDRHTRPCEPVWGALPPLAGGGSRRTCSSMFRETSTRPSTLALRLRLPGRVRSHDFCKRSLLRARPWTTRTSRAAGVGHRDDWHRRSKVALRSGQSPELREVRGRENPTLDAPHRDCSRWRLRPNPDRSEHLLSRASPFSPVWSDVGEGLAASAAPACKACARKGRATPVFREEERALTNPRCFPS